MLTASIICPHCGKSDLATFGEIHEFGVKDVVSVEVIGNIKKMEADPSKVISSSRTSARISQSDPLYSDLIPCVGLLFCQRCFNPIMAVTNLDRVVIANHVFYLRKATTGFKNSRLTMDQLTLFPEPKVIQSHPSWPERVQRLVPNIGQMIQQGFDPSIAISTSRTVIDICTKDLGGEGNNIYSRINNLLEKGVITKPIADWAHKVRLLGADATHDAEGTDEEVADLFNFINFFLRAAYELSADIAKGISEADASHDPKSKPT